MGEEEDVAVMDGQDAIVIIVSALAGRASPTGHVGHTEGEDEMGRTVCTGNAEKTVETVRTGCSEKR